MCTRTGAEILQTIQQPKASSYKDTTSSPASVLDGALTTEFSTAVPAAGAVEAWTGEFANGKLDVVKVVISTTADAAVAPGAANNLKVMIDDKLCGQTPATVVAGNDYTVTCPAGTSGSKVKVSKEYNGKALAFAQIKVYGFTCHYDGMVASIGSGSSASMQPWSKALPGQSCSAAKNLGSAADAAACSAMVQDQALTCPGYEGYFMWGASNSGACSCCDS